MKAADILAPVWRAIEAEPAPQPSCDLREQRLQQLMEEFEAARDAFADEYDAMIARTIWHDDVAKEHFQQVALAIRSSAPEDCSELESDKAQEVRRPARRYIIARDFNVFDPKRADMLWKLQNNNQEEDNSL